MLIIKFCQRLSRVIPHVRNHGVLPWSCLHEWLCLSLDIFVRPRRDLLSSQISTAQLDDLVSPQFSKVDFASLQAHIWSQTPIKCSVWSSGPYFPPRKRAGPWVRGPGCPAGTTVHLEHASFPAHPNHAYVAALSSFQLTLIMPMAQLCPPSSSP